MEKSDSDAITVGRLWWLNAWYLMQAYVYLESEPYIFHDTSGFERRIQTFRQVCRRGK